MRARVRPTDLISMDSQDPIPEVNRWLKRRYRETPVSGPQQKMVKFSDILDEARHAFPWVKISSYVLSNAITKEFPLLVSKKLGESRHK